jgi:hypothetical protein
MHNVRVGSKRVLLTDAEIEELDRYRASEKYALVRSLEKNTRDLAATRRAFDAAGERFLETIPDIIDSVN